MRIRDWSSDVCSSDLPPSPAKSRAWSKCVIPTIAIVEVDGQRHAPLSWASEVSSVIVGERDIAAVERVVLIEQIVHIDGNAHIALGDRIADTRIGHRIRWLERVDLVERRMEHRRLPGIVDTGKGVGTERKRVG